MKKSELRQVLKPLIKECIKEVIFEEGILSNIVSEVAQGLGGQTIVKHNSQPHLKETMKKKTELHNKSCKKQESVC